MHRRFRISNTDHRRRHRHALCVLVLVALLSACGSLNGSGAGGSPAAATPIAPTGAASTPGGTPVVLMWSMWGSAGELATHRRVAQSFMAQYPNIIIKIKHIPWESYHTELDRLIASGDPAQIPDVMFLAQDLRRYAEAGVIENLSPWIQRTGYNLDDYWPPLIQQATVNGSIYGLQRDLDLSLLYYNKTLFDAAGAPYPTDQWTWDDWERAAQLLTQTGAQGVPVRQGIAMEPVKWRILLAQSGGSFMDDPRNPSRCTLDTPESLRAVRFFAGLLSSGVAMRPADLEQIGGDANAFKEGRAAMIVQNASRVPVFNAAALNYDVALIPIPRGGRHINNSGGAQWVMSSRSRYKQEAWTFMSWLQSPSGGQRIYASSGDTFPAMRSVAASWVFTNRAQKPANRNAFLIEASTTKLLNFDAFAEGAALNETVIEPNLQKIWSGAGGVDATVATLCTEMNSFLKQHGYPK